MTLRELLVQFEIQNNLSHADVAKEVGVSKSTFSRVLNICINLLSMDQW